MGYPTQDEREALLRKALRGVEVSEREARTLRWIAGWEAETVERIAGLIEKARKAEHS